MRCTICGSEQFAQQPVLWPERVSEWKLEPHEKQYIDEQQDLSCVSCGSNLRAITLALAILTAFRFSGTLLEWADASSLTLLEINEAYTLTPIFQKIHGHILARYPEVDLHSLSYKLLPKRTASL